MDDFQDKLNSVLGNPEMMQQIMAMAQAMNQQPACPEPPPEPECHQSPVPAIDPALLEE